MTRNVKKIILSSIITLLVSAGLTSAADLISNQAALLPQAEASEVELQKIPPGHPMPCGDSNVR